MVQPGEILGLVGENGAGKTTLMKILAGIIHPTSGNAQVLGYNPWKRDNSYRKQIALIMGQKNQLWWDLPAADCYLLLREIYQIPEPTFRKNLDFLVETLDVSKQLGVQVRRLSLGERMKMELIAALLHNPKVVFLDEPTIGLDLTAQRAIRNFILEYRDLMKPVVILTSHYMGDIEHLCERIVIIKEGSFIYDGPIRAIVEEFASNKLITFHLESMQESAFKQSSSEIEQLGEIRQFSPEGLVVEVKPTDVGALAALVLDRCPVADMSIDEPDIGTVIEKIFNEQKRQP